MNVMLKCKEIIRCLKICKTNLIDVWIFLVVILRQQWVPLLMLLMVGLHHYLVPEENNFEKLGIRNEELTGLVAVGMFVSVSSLLL
jgi:hypothetical protein